MADDLSPADRASLAAERGPVNMTVGAALVFAGGPGLTRDAVLERVGQRLHLIPRYRQRLDEAPRGLANPVWVDDDTFDLPWHVRSATLPPPGGRAELADYVGREMSGRLDRRRPLWELHVVDGLEGGRVALVPKMHHALVDGIAAIDIGTVLLDPTPEPMDVPAPDPPWEPEPRDRSARIARMAATPFLRAQRAAFDGAMRALDTSPRSAAQDLRRATDLVTELARARPQAPMLPLNRTISPNRRYAMERISLAEVKATARLGDGTVNDVLLAAIAGMLRRCLDDDAGVPVALVPVSVRAEGEEGGNHISTVFVDLPVGEADPVARVRTIAAATRELKGSAAVRAGALMVGATGWAPPAVSSVLVRAMGGVRAFNLVVSNVPGPQQTFYVSGSALLEAYPVVPLNPANQGLSVGILSYDGGVHFGLLADRDLDPPVGMAASALRAALAEVAELAGA
jgi:diacylglycerol O-acyltransferase / wax synthase